MCVIPSCNTCALICLVELHRLTTMRMIPSTAIGNRVKSLPLVAVFVLACLTSTMRTIPSTATGNRVKSLPPVAVFVFALSTFILDDHHSRKLEHLSLALARLSTMPLNLYVVVLCIP